MKPMRVAHITTIDLSLRHLLLNQLLAIRDAGYEVTGISSPGPDVPLLEKHGIRHIAVPMTRSVTPLRDLRSLLQLYAVLRRERFDVVHTHNPKPGLLGQLAARAAGTPIVVNTLHGFYFHDHMRPAARRFFVALEKLAGRCSDVILSQNREDVSTAVREGIARRDRIVHLGNGIDLAEFDRARIDEELLAQKRDELGLPATSAVVGFVGRLVREKGVLELMEAARRFRGEDVRFLFVGPLDREKPDAVTPETARHYGVEDLCIFTGMRYDMPYMYALMDALVQPSHREGFPRAPMEAAAMGVPVVVTDVRGCREAVDAGTNGLLVPVRDAPALAAAVDRLVTDAALRNRLGENGRAVAEDRFDEQRVFASVIAQYDRLSRTVLQDDRRSRNNTEPGDSR